MKTLVKCLLLCPLALLPLAGQSFQVRYFANLDAGDSNINISNNGASASGTIFAPSGNLCVGVYTFDADEELASCCSCFVTPNGLVNISVRNSLISSTLTPSVPTSVVVKLLAWTAPSFAACDAGLPGPPAPGLAAWGTTLHARPGVPTTYGVTETAFSPATLSPNESAHISAFCQIIESTSSGFGRCLGCSPLGG